jgi:hypothetical protein
VHLPNINFNCSLVDHLLQLFCKTQILTAKAIEKETNLLKIEFPDLSNWYSDNLGFLLRNFNRRSYSTVQISRGDIDSAEDSGVSKIRPNSFLINRKLSHNVTHLLHWKKPARKE